MTDDPLKREIQRLRTELDKTKRERDELRADYSRSRNRENAANARIAKLRAELEKHARAWEALRRELIRFASEPDMEEIAEIIDRHRPEARDHNPETCDECQGMREADERSKEARDDD